jgi:transcriptional regulator with XRE-family HTH domain
MSTLGAAFKAEGGALRQNLDYRVDSFYVDIMDNIAAEMKRLEMNRSDLAAAMKVSPARVTNLLRGYKTNLEIRTIVQAALALGVEPNELCARRKTPEMLMRPLQTVPNGFVSVSIAEDVNSGKEQAA